MAKYPPSPYTMLEYNRTITLTNIDVLLKIWPGVEGKEQKRKKVAAFPTLLTMIVGPDIVHSGTRFLLEFSVEL